MKQINFAHLQKIHNNDKSDQKLKGNSKLTEHSKTHLEPAAKMKQSKNVDVNDDDSNNEYKLPDRVTDSSLGKSLETFRCEASEGEEGKVRESSGLTESLQISVGSAASKAMEILYSSGENS